MKRDNPKISVIMPSLNVKEFIGECIESVIGQTFRDLEIICVDGGSDDGTLEILEKYADNDSRIRIIQTDVKSYGHQMNLGISQAKGEYIGIVETDDFIDEGMYETLYELTDNSSADIAKVNFYHYYGEDDLKADTMKKNVITNEEFNLYESAYFVSGHPSIWAAIYKKDFLKKTGIEFMEAPGGGWVDNPFLFQTALSAEKIRYCHEPFYYYRELNPNSSTNDLKDLTLPMKRMLNLFDVLDEYSCSDEEILNVFYIRIFWHIKDTLKKDNYDDFASEIFKYTHEVVKKMDENIVKSRFGLKYQKLYYQYLSPLNLIDNVKKLDCCENVMKEHEFIYDYISRLEKQNYKLKSQNKKLKKENENYINEKQKIVDSKSYKLGNNVAKPIRFLKKLK